MANDLGTKYTCHHCGAKFYDMKKPAPICPKCGTDQRSAPAKVTERKRAPAPKVEADESEDALKDSESEDEEEESVEEEEDV